MPSPSHNRGSRTTFSQHGEGTTLARRAREVFVCLQRSRKLSATLRVRLFKMRDCCRAASHLLTIEEAKRRCPDMVKGQVWRGALAKYKFRCKVHGMVYRQRLNNRVDGQSGCLKCKRIARGDFTITEMESRFPNMVKGQKCRGTQVKYRFLCEIHGRYRQRYDHHYHHGCKKCADKDNASVCRSSTAEFIAKARRNTATSMTTRR